MSLSALFRPFVLNGLALPNRIVMAPMTRWKSPGGMPGADVAAYYRRRAENDCGLIITEGTTVDHPVASYSERVPVFHGAALPAWKRVVDEVHDAGGRIMPQLWHVGVSRRPGQDYPNRHLPSLSPSGLFHPDRPPVAPPATREDIRAVVAAFAEAAGRAREIGFDGIELHGAHGYLIDQFFWPAINHRDDEYGGSLENRLRFSIETLQAIRREVGDDYPLILRVSQWKEQDYDAQIADSPAALAAWLQPLADAGVDAFHCSQRRYWQPTFPDAGDGAHLNLAGWARRVTGRPAITVGSVGLDGELVTRGGDGIAAAAGVAAVDDVAQRLAAGEFDLVAVGRALLADPAWARKLREGRSDALLPYTAAALETLT